MPEDFKTYLEKSNFEKYFEKLKKKIGNKKVILYGTGSLFQYIKKQYDFYPLNIIGISDLKYTIENKEDFGYKTIPKDLILKYKPDYVIVCIQNYLEAIEDLTLNTFKNKNIKVYPLVRFPLIQLIKTILIR